MIESLIATSHHYYVTIFNTVRVKSLSDFLSIFEGKIYKEPVLEKNPNFLHIQLLLDKPYGNETLLQGNKVVKKDKVYYWHDLYIGKIEINRKKIFFISYPYNGIKKFISEIFLRNNFNCEFHKPQVKSVLDYMKLADREEAADTQHGFSARIIKYTAAIMDSFDANKINISGQNPLNSNVFKILSKEPSIKIKTTSLKLKCEKIDTGKIEISFDRIGNFRFWIKKDGAEYSIPMIPVVYNFFNEIDALDIDEFISSQTLLEDE